MSQYRIVKRGNTETYKVQEKFLWFWIDKCGTYSPLTLKEARELLQAYKNLDEYRKNLKAKDTVVE